MICARLFHRFGKIDYFSLPMTKAIHTIIALVWYASVAAWAQEPGVPLALQAIAGGAGQRGTGDSVATVHVSTGFYQTLPPSWIDAAGHGTQQGEVQRLHRTAVFVSVNRPLGRHFSAGFCLPWYRTSVEYTGKAHPKGNYGVEKISEMRLYLDYHYAVGVFRLLAESGTNIPVGNGLPSALHPAFPPGENGYWSLWVKAGLRMKARSNLDLYALMSYDFTVARSGALLEGADAILFTSGAAALLQATIDPGDRVGFTTGAVLWMQRYELSLGYGFLYRYPKTAVNILPETGLTDATGYLTLMPRSVLHSVHSGCFRTWKDFRAGVMIQAGVGGFNSWSEVLMSGLISYNIQ